MPAAADTTWVSGYAGFIGGHFLRSCADRTAPVVAIDRLPAPRHGSGEHGVRYVAADIRDLPRLKSEYLRHPMTCDRLVHLAAEAEVVMPWEDTADLLKSNVEGTCNIVDALDPRVCIFASSSSVYGNATRRMSHPGWNATRPQGLYGASKLTGEFILRDWAAAKGASAVIMRLGNVIGPGCRGLIPYLVRHGFEHPAGGVPAMLRGGGVLLRDYVPVSHVVSVFAAALECSWPEGATRVFNVGTGSGLTNRQVAEVVQRVLERNGITLHLDFSTPVATGEAERVIMDARETRSTFGVELPRVADIVDCIEASVLHHLERLQPREDVSATVTAARASV